MEHSSPAFSSFRAIAQAAPRALEATVAQPASATVSPLTRDDDTVARKHPGAWRDLDASSAGVATIWLVCYLVIGLGWAVHRLHVAELIDAVRVAVAH